MTRVGMSHSSEAEQLIRIMRRLAYPVTVITTCAGERRRGITIGSFTSLSLDPPLVSYNVTVDSQMHEVLEKASRFVIHLPGSHQESLCTRFSLPDKSDDEQFEGVSVDSSEAGAPPLLADVNSRLHCRLFRNIPVGDHSIFIGKVIRTEFLGESPAMLYLDGQYRSLDDLPPG